MNRNILSFGLVAAMLTTSVTFNALADKEDTGAIVGAIVGGILGNQVGKGNGKTVATGVGIILGAVIGADIGKSLDENDRRALEEAQRDAFRRPIGERTDWDGNRYGSRTGARGNFRTTREGYLRSNSREVCREYESVIVTRQKTETKTGIACSRADGTWREVNSTEVVFRDGSSVRNETVTSGNGGRGYGYGGPVRPMEPVRPMHPRPRPNPGYITPAPQLPMTCMNMVMEKGYGPTTARQNCEGINYPEQLNCAKLILDKGYGPSNIQATCMNIDYFQFSCVQKVMDKGYSPSSAKSGCDGLYPQQQQCIQFVLDRGYGPSTVKSTCQGLSAYESQCVVDIMNRGYGTSTARQSCQR